MVFLRRFGAWDVISGAVSSSDMEVVQQQWCDSMDDFSKDSLLRGVKTEDTERICEMGTAAEMWHAIESIYTKGEY